MKKAGKQIQTVFKNDTDLKRCRCRLLSHTSGFLIPWNGRFYLNFLLILRQVTIAAVCRFDFLSFSISLLWERRGSLCLTAAAYISFISLADYKIVRSSQFSPMQFVVLISFFWSHFWSEVQIAASNAHDHAVLVAEKDGKVDFLEEEYFSYLYYVISLYHTDQCL